MGTLDNFKNMEPSDLKDICDSFGFNVTQKIRLKQAVKKLQKADENEPEEEKKDAPKLSKKDEENLKEIVDFEYKAVMLGDSRVGKNSLVIRIVKNHFDQYKFPTIGATFLKQTVPIEDHDNVISTV